MTSAALFSIPGNHSFFFPPCEITTQSGLPSELLPTCHFFLEFFRTDKNRAEEERGGGGGERSVWFYFLLSIFLFFLLRFFFFRSADRWCNRQPKKLQRNEKFVDKEKGKEGKEEDWKTIFKQGWLVKKPYLSTSSPGPIIEQPSSQRFLLSGSVQFFVIFFCRILKAQSVSYPPLKRGCKILF